jgi:ABC-type lipoprotein export system ATPase subunit
MEEIIRFQDIIKHYHIGTMVVEAIRSITLSMHRNEYIAIMASPH